MEPANEADLMSPPRQNAGRIRERPPNLQSTPLRNPRQGPVRAPGTPEQRPGTTLKSLTNGQKASIVLKVNEEFYYYRGGNHGTNRLAIRLNNPNLEIYRHKQSSTFQNLVFRVIIISRDTDIHIS